MAAHLDVVRDEVLLVRQQQLLLGGLSEGHRAATLRRCCCVYRSCAPSPKVVNPPKKAKTGTGL